jgi:hypothetical protein
LGLNCDQVKINFSELRTRNAETFALPNIVGTGCAMDYVGKYTVYVFTRVGTYVQRGSTFCFVVLVVVVVVETLVRSNQKAVLRQSTFPDLTTSLAIFNL